jgi:hypothetical protein
MVAWIAGFLGSAFCLGIGVLKLGYSPAEVLWWIGAANLMGVVGPMMTLRAEQSPGFKSRVLSGRWQTWIFLLVTYFGGLLLLVPALQEAQVFFWVVVPLLMSTGLMLNPIFGPLRDWMVRNAQRGLNRQVTEQPRGHMETR